MSTQLLSDFNNPGYISKRTASSALFSDFNLGMRIHPNKKDIVPLTDIDAIKNALKNLILTNFGEKLFMPNFGGNITSYLFENNDGFTALAMRNEILEVITRFEKRVTDVVVQVSDDGDANAYRITIGFRINNTQQTTEVEFALQRIR
jgi:phage baseplate assembly protein W